MFKKLTTVILSIAVMASSADITALAAEIPVEVEGAQITDTEEVSGFGVSETQQSKDVLVEEIITDDSLSGDSSSVGTADPVLADRSKDALSRISE